MRRRTMPHNAPASWSVGLGLVSMVLLYVYWPASPVVAVAAVVCGVLGLRAAERGFGGKGRAMVGLFYAATALVVLGVILYLFY